MRNNVLLVIICSICIISCSEREKPINILFAGDIMLDRGTKQTIITHNPDYLFSDIDELLKKQDAVIANFECTSCDTSCPETNKQCRFRCDPLYLSSIKKAGIDYLGLANNHSMDRGSKGLFQTVKNCYNRNIHCFGEDSINDSIVINKADNHIIIFATNLINDPQNKCNSASIDRICSQIKRNKNQNTVVMIFIHWGIEKQNNPTNEQTVIAHKFIDCGADAIIGHHPHVIQTIEKYRDKYIFYSVGNFIFDNNSFPCNLGLLASFKILHNRILSSEFFPFKLKASKPFLLDDEQSQTIIKKIIVNSNPKIQFSR
jgi:poly-gamma-glutamate capsule biosynthesis protein CapA/YwtB (metallophosphatase superfamily)